MRIAQTLSGAEVLRKFSTERKAVAWLERVRWGKSPVCAHCGTVSASRRTPSKKFTYWCGACRKHFTARTGTVMHGTNLPVRIWLAALYCFVTARKGTSSVQLSKELGVTQKTSWFILHRLRKACGPADDFVLKKLAEIDETYLGGKERNKHASKKLHAGRGAVGKQAVLGMRERDSHTVAMPIPDTKKETLQGAIAERVQGGAVLCTDEHGGYECVEELGYSHESVNHSAKQFVGGMAATNSIESVWALVKRDFYGTYHKWSRKHCSGYVNEFTYRMNAGNCEIDTIDRMAWLCRAMANKKITFEQLTAEDG